MVVLEGYHPRAAGTLRHDGFVVRRYLAIPSLERMESLIPLGGGAAASYAVRQRLASATGWKRLAGGLYGRLLARGMAAPTPRLVTVGLRDPAPPRLVTAAGEFGVDARGGWFVGLGPDHLLSRGVFMSSRPARTPRRG